MNFQKWELFSGSPGKNATFVRSEKYSPVVRGALVVGGGRVVIVASSVNALAEKIN